MTEQTELTAIHTHIRTGANIVQTHQLVSTMQFVDYITIITKYIVVPLSDQCDNCFEITGMIIALHTPLDILRPLDAQTISRIISISLGCGGSYRSRQYTVWGTYNATLEYDQRRTIRLMSLDLETRYRWIPIAMDCDINYKRAIRRTLCLNRQGHRLFRQMLISP